MRKMNMAPNLIIRQDMFRDCLETLEYLISGDCTDSAVNYWEEIGIAMAAIQTQIAMKPIKKYATQVFCPVCNKRLRSGNGSSSLVRDYWCNHCGQAIDWEEVNE